MCLIESMIYIHILRIQEQNKLSLIFKSNSIHLVNNNTFVTALFPLRETIGRQ